MFHPHFLRLFFGIPHTTAEAMGFNAAFKVEEDLQRTWREEREREIQSEVGCTTEEHRGRPVSLRK